MAPSLETPPVTSKTNSKYKPLLSLAKSALATSALMAGILGIWFFNSGPGFTAWHQPGDNISDENKQQRIRDFSSLTSVALPEIKKSELPAAIEGMHLPLGEKQALLADFARTSHVAVEASPETLLPSSPANNQQEPTPDVKSIRAQPNPDANAKLATAKSMPQDEPPLRLAWITLLDTDAEDGDTVRIDSQGYSRTIVLTKQPLTFAIPVPTNGAISITGVRDGEGGGITVGLASGDLKALLPIMSEGQTLRLSVKVK